MDALINLSTPGVNYKDMYLKIAEFVDKSHGEIIQRTPL